MSRSGYSDNIDNWELIRWRGMVASSIRGRRGQRFLRDLLVALDTMPVKELIAHELVKSDGRVCAMGALGLARGVDMTKVDPTEPQGVASIFDIAECLAQEVAYENDDVAPRDPAKRWQWMRAWAAANIREGR